MAYIDYLHCSKCEGKLIYDGLDAVSNELEDRFGTDELICPDCYKKETNEARNLLRHIHGYLYLNWADNGTLKDRIEAFLAKHKERING